MSRAMQHARRAAAASGAAHYSHEPAAAAGKLKPHRLSASVVIAAAAEALPGLGRVVALYHRPSASHRTC
jgi:hypothetical protein